MYNNTTINSTVTGTSVGLYSPVDPLAIFHIINPNENDLKILIAVHGYDNTAPIPGGCNMEMPVPTAPFLKTEISPNKDYITVDGAAPRDDLSISCDIPRNKDMEFYRIYLPERDFSIDTYFGGIKAMMNFDSIKEIGEIIPC
ncbi:hypothetical protein MSG28_009220 [Choristoneura fumiferana]|uniref:Uncharacterized protein n=1 Tax=Choristoneura fumiferana TaxID=7141 RepID=A0ACC0KXA2_CHOFU|nr:hypothetical protein MSG28_009220 [Choristoneura fumiferana]